MFSKLHADGEAEARFASRHSGSVEEWKAEMKTKIHPFSNHAVETEARAPQAELTFASGRGVQQIAPAIIIENAEAHIHRERFIDHPELEERRVRFDGRAPASVAVFLAIAIAAH